MISEAPLCWFAARTRACQELSVRNKLRQWEVEHYLPTEQTFRRLSDRVKQVEVPVIHNLIFIRCTKTMAFSLLNDYALRIGYIKDPATNSLLVIPDKQLEDFRLVMQTATEKTIYTDEAVLTGDRVLVVEGAMSGVEGTMIRLNGKTHVLIRIVGVVTITVKVPRSALKKIKSS